MLLCCQEKQRKLAEEQRNLVQQQAQAKAQMARYEDELARKRMQVIEFLFLLSSCKSIYFKQYGYMVNIFLCIDQS